MIAAEVRRRVVIRALLLVGAAPFAFTAVRAQSPLREWKLSAAPTLVIADDGTPATEFFQVGAPWRLSDGRIVVPDGSTKELRVFDARGTYVTKFGRMGSGPGEFRVMRCVGHFGDTTFVYDGTQRRVTTILMSAAPHALGAFAVPEFEIPSSDICGRMADGRWLFRSSERPNLQGALGVQRIASRIGLLGADASGPPQWLAEAQDFSVLVDAPDPVKKLVSIYAAAFAARVVTLASGSVIWIGDTAGDSLIWIDVMTGGRRVVRLPDAPIPLTDAVVRAARTRELAVARSEPEKAGIERKYEAAHLPRTHPTFSDIIAGMSGEIWVKRRLPTGAPGGESTLPGEYVIVAATGVPVGRLKVPAAFRITDVGRDFVLGVQADPDGVESVRVYALTR